VPPILPPETVPETALEALARSCGLSLPLAELLWRRGHRSPEEARAWLDADPRGLHDPFLFRAMPRAVERIRKALRDRERILIHGDYDVDGLTGTVVLLSFFRMLQAEVDWFIPRRDQGYSFSEASIEKIREGGHRLCISVDNGTAAGREIEAIQALGCDVLVTDHHGGSGDPAPAFAILNPRLEDAGYPDPHLAGVGVAFKLAWAVAESFSSRRILSEEFRRYLHDAAALVALGTVADIVPLTGENRILVRMGMKALRHTGNPGLAALLDVLGPERRTMSAEDVSFRLGPRLNAAGRMGHADTALRLLTASSYGEARRLADELERMNRRRQQVEAATLEKAEAFLASAPGGTSTPVLLAWGEDWHLGVLGIVAARLVDKYRRPALVLTVKDGLAQGSGRSLGGIDLRALLERVSDRLLRWGGHARAVGLRCRAEDCEGLREALRQAPLPGVNRPEAPIQAEVRAPLARWSSSELKALARFRPFGEGNPLPRFLATGVRISRNARRIGPGGRGLLGTAIQDGTALSFHAPVLGHRLEEFLGRPGPWTLLYTPQFAARPEAGPIQLHVHAIEAEASRSRSLPAEERA